MHSREGWESEGSKNVCGRQMQWGRRFAWCTCIDELTAKRVLLAAEAEKTQAGCEIFDNCIHDLEVDAATREGSWALLFKLFGKKRANMAEVWVCDSLDKIYELCSLIEWLSQTVSRSVRE